MEQYYKILELKYHASPEKAKINYKLGASYYMDAKQILITSEEKLRFITYNMDLLIPGFFWGVSLFYYSNCWRTT